MDIPVNSAPGASKAFDLTPLECKCLQHTRDAWNIWLEIGGHHPDDIDEFRRAIHRLQDLIAYRQARRVNPETWK